MTTDSGAAARWTPGGVRLFAALLVAFQIIQGLSDPILPGNRRFTESYYLVTYGHGFIRRGLLGEGLHVLLGLPTRSEVDVTADVVVAMSVGAVVLVIELLIRRGTSSSCATALLLAASPFTIDFFIVDRRPDLLALVLLVALGLVLSRAGPALVPGIIAVGIGFGAMVLVHEDVILIEVPWAMVLVATAALGREDRDGDVRQHGRPTGVNVLLGILVGLPLAATAAVLGWGLPSSRQVAGLQADLSPLHLTGNTVFTYLPDSLRASVRLVGSIPPSAKAWTLVLGIVLVTLQVLWVRSWTRPHLAQVFVASGHRRLGAVLAATVIVTTAILFATGFDWVRWFADCGAAWLVVQAFVPLLAGESGHVGDLAPVDPDGTSAGHPDAPTEGRAPRIHLSRWLPALAVYLAAVPPLDDLFITGQLRHFLFFI